MTHFLIFLVFTVSMLSRHFKAADFKTILSMLFCWQFHVAHTLNRLVLVKEDEHHQCKASW